MINLKTTVTKIKLSHKEMTFLDLKITPGNTFEFQPSLWFCFLIFFVLSKIFDISNESVHHLGLMCILMRPYFIFNTKQMVINMSSVFTDNFVLSK